MLEAGTRVANHRTLTAVLDHWPEYLMEAAGVGILVSVACLAGVSLEHPDSALVRVLPSVFTRRLLMGLVMGTATALIVYSPWGKQSGAHLNPSVSLTFFRLGKVRSYDLFLYGVSQLSGAALAIAAVANIFGIVVAHPAIRYLVTVPEHGKFAEALVVEFLVGSVTMTAILVFSNSSRLERYVGLVAGALAALYFTFEAPFFRLAPRGMQNWGQLLLMDAKLGLWIYFTAPPLGMLAAAELYLWRRGRAAVKCAKLNHSVDKRCIFCGFRPAEDSHN